ncbi:hypothetical protein DOY81_012184 [Sarcophaga bullata]|nr:hypothetical protein DOY81_012184 [Sarcophaga bullata]
MNAEKLRRLQSQVRIGGKGTPRRKKKVMHQSAATDDKKLQSSLKKLSVSTIPGIEEPKLLLSASTFAVTGHGETKKIVEMLPEILPQLGQDTVMQLRMFANTMSANQKASNNASSTLDNVAEEDEDVPLLVNDFEEVAKMEETKSAKPKADSKPQEEMPKNTSNGILNEENNKKKVEAAKEAAEKSDKKSKKQQNKQTNSNNNSSSSSSSNSRQWGS